MSRKCMMVRSAVHSRLWIMTSINVVLFRRLVMTSINVILSQRWCMLVRKVGSLRSSVVERGTLYVQGLMHLRAFLPGGRQGRRGLCRRWTWRATRPRRPVSACRGRQDANGVIRTWCWSAVTVLTVLTLTEINNKSLRSGRSWMP